MIELTGSKKADTIPFTAEVRIGDIAVGMSGPPENMDAIIKYIDAVLLSAMNKIDNMGIMKVLKDRISETSENQKRRDVSNERIYG